MDTRDDAREARSARAKASRARAFGSGKLEKTRGRTGSTHQFAREGAQVQVRRVQVPQRRVAVPDVDESVVVLVGSVVVRVRGRVRGRVRPLVLGLAHGLVFRVRVGAPVSEGEILRVTRRVVVRRAVRGAATRVLLGVNVVLRDERFGGVGVFHLLVALGRRRLLGAVGARVLSNPTSHLGGSAVSPHPSSRRGASPKSAPASLDGRSRSARAVAIARATSPGRSCLLRVRVDAALVSVVARSEVLVAGNTFFARVTSA